MLNLVRRPGVVSLAADAVSQAADLVQTELRLARAEMTEKLVTLRGGLIMLLFGAIFLVAALFLVLQSLVAMLVAAGLEPHWAVLLVAGASAAAGYAFIHTGRERLEHLDLTPERTLTALSRDGRMAKEKLS